MVDKFEGKYDELMVFIDTGAQGNLPDELVEYLSIIELIRGLHLRYTDRLAIIKFLQQPPYNLSPYQATMRYSEAINFFYVSHDIKKKAYRNMYADDLDRAANLIFKTATNSKDIDVYKNTKLAAADLRQLNQADQEDIPKEFYQKTIKIYTLDPEKLGKRRANKLALARHIDSLDVPEADKERARNDAGLNDTIDFIEIDENEDQ